MHDVRLPISLRKHCKKVVKPNPFTNNVVVRVKYRIEIYSDKLDTSIKQDYFPVEIKVQL